MEGLRVLRAQRLVGRRAARADDGERHLELASRGGKRVARRRDLRHGVDGEVGVHHLDDRPVAVHALPDRLAEEVALVDDLVRAAQLAEGLLGQLGDVVRRARLQVLRVADRRRVAQHLFQHREVDGVGDRDLAALGQRLQLGDVRLAIGERLRVGRRSRDRVGAGGRRPRVVVRRRRVRELELLRELGGRRRRLACKVERLLDDGLDALEGAVEVEPARRLVRLEELDRVRLRARPLLFVLAAALVLRVGGRVALEAVRVNLHDGGPLLAHVVDHGAPRLERLLH
mmetsp:Transcript_29952/g.100106  ORF Transcript_29952/g.100106 Transcript_29952/m.100106 type:complete len:286 (+) Transcript_29952:958-1815(+)